MHAAQPKLTAPARLRHVKQPAEGIPQALTTPDAFARAADTLAAGTGPFAIDTERAGTYRYDDRAFLLQVRRRGAGTFLFAPENHREELSEILVPVLNDQDWVMHAAPTDMPSLAMLGLHPGSLFDTELAGRLAGLDKVGLGPLIATLLGIDIDKNHGAEDWSTVPLPKSWLSYAALDVEYLLDLADTLREYLDAVGKLEWAEQEFAYITESFSTAPTRLPDEEAWRHIKGAGKLRTRLDLAAAKEMWDRREALARKNDVSPQRLLPDRTLVEAAVERPTSKYEFSRIPKVNRRHMRNVGLWLAGINRALQMPRPLYPRLKDFVYQSENGSLEHAPASTSTWKRLHPEAYDLLVRTREEVQGVGAAASVRPDTVLSARVLRTAVWHASEGPGFIDAHELALFLEDKGARPWQISLVMPVLRGLITGRST